MWTLLNAVLAAWLIFGWLGSLIPDYVLLVPLVLLLRERRRELR